MYLKDKFSIKVWLWNYFNENVCAYVWWNNFVSYISLIFCTAELFHSLFIHSLVFSLEGQAWQEPEPSHVTSMALAHCILGKFLGVVCHCFPQFIIIWDELPALIYTQSVSGFDVTGWPVGRHDICSTDSICTYIPAGNRTASVSFCHC